MLGFLYPWGAILQVVAIVHFIRRRPDTYWLWIIIIFGPLGALAYIVAEVIPDAGLVRGSLRVFPRRRRIRELETIVIDNPAIGNFEELADLYLEDGKFARARELYDKVIARVTNGPDPFYRRGIAALELGDAPAAVCDLERVVSTDPKYDFHRAVGLLAHAYALTGHPEQAELRFRQATEISTLSETYFNYATFLAAQARPMEAKAWAERILAKKPTMPSYLRRRERPWFRKAKSLLKSLPAS
jgi:hypothetical protein